MMLRSLNIAIGNFFFRRRNFLFPCVFLLTAGTSTPEILFGSQTLDLLFVGSGAIEAMLGETVRFVTIGFQYIHRGGKNGKVYANHLVSGGMYGVVRNPMYVGNALIAIGMAKYTGAPRAIIIVVPFFLFVYQAIVFAEEEYLRNKFGAEYDEYCARVNRFIPSLGRVRQSFVGMQLDWKTSIKKDLGTIVGLAIGLLLIPVWRTYFHAGWDAAKSAAMTSFAIACACGVLYALLLYLKRRKRFIFRSPAV
jgi:protein-S-isoprenylcysteine O-methyltransferase Ste14